MINVSKEYEQKILGERVFYAGGKIILEDSTELALSNSNIMYGGFSFDDGVSSESSFDIGSAIINKLEIILDNSKFTYDTYDFTNAVIIPTIGLQLSSTIETLQKGRFNVDTAVKVGSTIVITAYDNMVKFDVPFSKITQTYPCSALTLLNNICSHCGVTLSTQSFDGKDFVINSIDNSNAMTCREIVSYIAQIGCNFARINTSGYLELKWFNTDVFEIENGLDGGTFKPHTLGDVADGGNFTFTETTDYDGGSFNYLNSYHNIFKLQSLNLEVDDVVITGVKVSIKNTDGTDKTSYYPTTGYEGYIISIESNPLINTTTIDEIATFVGQKLVGIKFRPLDASILSDPSIEAGDIAYITDANGRVYNCLITNSRFKLGSFQKISCDAKSPSVNSSTRYSNQTKVIVESRKNTEVQLSSYDQRMQELTSLITGGFGMYKTEETQLDGSIIYYMHNKPTLVESDVIWKFTDQGLMVSKNGGTTFALDSNGNALFNVITTHGLVADWITTGLLKCVDESSYIDLDAGTFQFGNGTIVFDGMNLTVLGDLSGSTMSNGNGTFSVDEDGHVEAGDLNITGGNLVISTSMMEEEPIILNYTDASTNGYIYSNKIRPVGMSMSQQEPSVLYTGNISSLSIQFTDHANKLSYLSINGMYTTGTKNRIVNTEHYGMVGQNAYETCSPYFGDIGSNKTDSTGCVRIDLEEVFKETLDLTNGYKVFLQECGDGKLYVEKYDSYFLVKGTPNLDFDYEIKAPQKDYLNHRLEKFEMEEINNGNTES